MAIAIAQSTKASKRFAMMPPALKSATIMKTKQARSLREQTSLEFRVIEPSANDQKVTRTIEPLRPHDAMTKGEHAFDAGQPVCVQ